MSALILPGRYTAQARGPVEIDYAHPLGASVVSAYNMTSAPLRTSADTTGRYNGRKSSAGKNPYTLHGFQNDGTTEAGLVYCSEGAVWDFGGTYTTKAYNTKHPVSWSGAVTFVIRVLLRSNTADQCLIGHFNDGVSPDYLYGCGLYVTGGTLYAVGASNNSRVLSTTAPATDEWVTLACVTNTADGKLAIDGQVVATGTLAGALSSYVFAIGCAGHTAGGATSGTAFLDGLVGPALVFNRALSDAEIRSISENPYQVLKSPRRALWLDVVAGGGGATASPAGVEATTAVGTATATGAASATPSGVTSTAELGTVSATGGAGANANPAGVQATASIGTATASGQAAVSVSGVAATASVGDTQAGASATAAPTGVTSTATVGTAAATGATTATVTGQSTDAQLGSVTAVGAANAQPSGVSATAAVGQASGPVQANATPTGVSATATVGTVHARVATFGVRGVAVASARRPAGQGNSVRPAGSGGGKQTR